MTTLEVFLDAEQGLEMVGQAHVTRSRRRLSTTFLYDPGYLAGGGVAIDPALPLVSGAQHQLGLVRALSDSAPDRWGRNLIDKSERVRAREQSLAPRQLDDLDYLLGVSDDTRQGALRYRLQGGGSFLGAPSKVPRLVSLPELLSAADRVSDDADPSRAIQELLDTGTTGLGGARPKASVRLEDGSLAIAKFPHSSDDWDVMAWEATALDLLEDAGIRTPARRLTRVGDRSVLILRRFDRAESGQRLGYISALTALSAFDGDHRDYADIAESIRDLSRSPRDDHHQLFDRVVASVVLGDTDDHLRNHGFLMETGGWRLSPAFDVNPGPDLGRPRSTSIMGADTFPDESKALPALAGELSLTPEKGRERMRRVAQSLAHWPELARRNGIPGQQITMMAVAIEPRRDAVLAAAAD